MLDHLYIRPGPDREGIGSRFVALAKVAPAGWPRPVHVPGNAGARRFYERHGFRVVDFDDDGARNEEHQPDVRYRWRPAEPTIS